jgi:hypothetical protein
VDSLEPIPTFTGKDRVMLFYLGHGPVGMIVAQEVEGKVIELLLCEMLVGQREGSGLNGIVPRRRSMPRTWQRSV